MTRPTPSLAEANGLFERGSVQRLARERRTWAEQVQPVAFYSRDGMLQGPNHYVLPDGRTLVELIPGSKASKDKMIVREPGKNPEERTGDWLRYDDTLRRLNIEWKDEPTYL